MLWFNFGFGSSWSNGNQSLPGLTVNHRIYFTKMFAVFSPLPSQESLFSLLLVIHYVAALLSMRKKKKRADCFKKHTICQFFETKINGGVPRPLRRGGVSVVNSSDFKFCLDVN